MFLLVVLVVSCLVVRFVFMVIFFFKQKTAYEMRISGLEFRRVLFRSRRPYPGRLFVRQDGAAYDVAGHRVRRDLRYCAAYPISGASAPPCRAEPCRSRLGRDRKSTRLNSSH